MIYLVEHFYSIQGEGKNIGTPSLFFRFGGCNMTCQGFLCREKNPEGKEIIGCDTVYAVDRSFSSHWIGINGKEELIYILNSYDLPFAVDVVFTGGEPLIYANEKIFISFLTYLYENGHNVTFETNATISPNFLQYNIYKKCTYALSVKLKNSKEPYHKRVRPDVIAQIAQNAKESFFKFSVDKNSIDASLDTEIETITAYAPYLDVYCMPIGGSKKMIEENTPDLVEYCKQKGYKFSDRLHIRIWDENKGI